MLRGGGGAQAFCDLGDEVVGDIVLLDARLDVVDMLDLYVYGDVASDDPKQVGHLVIADSISHAPRGAWGVDARMVVGCGLWVVVMVPGVGSESGSRSGWRGKRLVIAEMSGRVGL